MSTKKPPPTTSKRDLLAAVKQYGRTSSPQLEELHRKQQETKEALEQFEKTNEEYLRLATAAEVANDAAWRAQREEEEQQSKVLRKIRTAIYTRGPTEAVIKMVEELSQKSND